MKRSCRKDNLFIKSGTMDLICCTTKKVIVTNIEIKILRHNYKNSMKKIAYDAIYDCMFRVIYPHFTYMYVHVVADFVVIFNMLKYAFQHYSTSILGFLKRMSQYCSELPLFLTRRAKPSLKLWNESLTVSVWFLYLYILSFLF